MLRRKDFGSCFSSKCAVKDKRSLLFTCCRHSSSHACDWGSDSSYYFCNGSCGRTPAGNGVQAPKLLKGTPSWGQLQSEPRCRFHTVTSARMSWQLDQWRQDSICLSVLKVTRVVFLCVSRQPMRVCGSSFIRTFNAWKQPWEQWGEWRWNMCRWIKVCGLKPQAVQCCLILLAGEFCVKSSFTCRHHLIFTPRFGGML